MSGRRTRVSEHAAVGTCKGTHHVGNGVEVNIGPQGHVSRAQRENLPTSKRVGRADVEQTIQTAWPQQSRVLQREAVSRCQTQAAA